MKMINNDLKNVIGIGAGVTVLLSLVCLFIDFRCAFICLLLGIVLTTVFFFVTKKRYKKLSELNDYLSLICAGNFDLDISDNTEGELSILKNNLYKVISILQTQNEMLKRDKVYLADSIADISHQLKTPLTSMMVMTDLLCSETDVSKRSQFISVIENQLDRMKWLITNLLKISKLDSGTIVLKQEKHSSAELIKSAVEPFILTLELKKITLDNTVSDFLLNIDRSWTVEAVQNIIKNCIEHTDAGGSLFISSENTHIFDVIRIRDNGSGIAEEDLPHIFERFYHGKNSSKDSVGIGLALAKAVLEKENADINVTSTEGVGTEFVIKFYKSII